MKKVILLVLLSVATSCSALTHPNMVNISQVSTMADLRTINPSTSDIASKTSVVLAGYYAPGDGGEGTFVWDSAAVTTGGSEIPDNLGTFIKPTAVASATPGRWIRVYDGNRISVKWFGAKGDGVTDDYVPIQYALNHGAQNGQGTVYFPAKYYNGARNGLYAVSQSLVIGTPAYNASGTYLYCIGVSSGLTLEGAGSGIPGGEQAGIKWIGANQPGTTKVWRNSLPASYSFITDDRGVIEVNACQGFMIKNLDIRGDNKAYYGIKFDLRSMYATVSNCSVFDCKVGISNGSTWDLVAQVEYGGILDDPNGIAAAARYSGGWQTDHFTVDTVNTMRCTLASIVDGSAQGFFHTYKNVDFSDTATGLFFTGAHATLDACNFTGISSYCILQPTGAGRIIVTNSHAENNTTSIFMQTPAAQTFTTTDISNSNLGDLDILVKTFGGNMRIANCDGLNMINLQQEVSILPLNLSVENCIFKTIDIATMTIANNIRINTSNCVVDTDFTGVGAPDARGIDVNLAVSGGSTTIGTHAVRIRRGRSASEVLY